MGMDNSVGEQSRRGTVLLSLARQEIERVFGVSSGERPGELREPTTDPWLAEPGATFVTLKLDGELHGCIGSVTPYRPLGEDLKHNACSAAFHDPRFEPLTAAQLPLVRIEVSLLSPVEPLKFESEEDLLSQLEPGVDGLVLESGLHRGTFLPQVWEQLPEPRDFLRHLKRKAGLEPGFWSPEIRVSRYTVAKWGEDEVLRR